MVRSLFQPSLLPVGDKANSSKEMFCLLSSMSLLPRWYECSMWHTFIPLITEWPRLRPKIKK